MLMEPLYSYGDINPSVLESVVNEWIGLIALSNSFLVHVYILITFNGIHLLHLITAIQNQFVLFLVLVLGPSLIG